MIQKNDTERNKGGRPAKGLSEKRKYRITVKMATGEYYALKSKARQAGVSASEMVRQAVDGCVVRERLTAEQADFIRKLCGMANKPEPAYPEGTPGGRVPACRPMPATAAVAGNPHRPYQPMMAKIVKGAGARGIVDYILDREKGASLIDHDGVLVSDNGSIVRSFIAQSRLNPNVEKFIGHISLSFSKEDLPRLTDGLMVQISREYMMEMGIRDTQYIIGRHHDKGHPHVHIAFNRIDNNGKTISDKNDRYRSERVCKELTRKYGLYFAEGKEQVNTNRLKEPDRTKYELYSLLKTEVGRCGNWDRLVANLRKQGGGSAFQVQGADGRDSGRGVRQERLFLQRLED